MMTRLLLIALISLAPLSAGRKNELPPDAKQARDYYYRAEQLMEQRKFAEAVDSYQKALIVKPGHLVVTQRLELAKQRAADAAELDELRRTVADLAKRVAALEAKR